MAKQNKRGNAEGSVYLDESVGLWRGSISLGHKVNAKGQSVRVRKTVTGATRQEADRKLTELKRRVDQNLPVGDGRSVGVLLLQWLEAVKTDQSIRPKTYRSYEQMVRNHLAPALFPKAERKKHAPEPKVFEDFGLAKIKLAKLSIADVNKFLAAKLADGCSVPLVRYLRVVLRAGLSFAERSDLVSRNVAKLSTLPKKAAGDDGSLVVEPFTAAEAKQFLDATRGHRFEALFTSALALGLRHGEALGLQWPDFDAETATLRVFYQLQPLDGKLGRVPTKSAKSRRLVHLPALCLDALKAHRERQETERAFAGEKWRETGYIFTSRIGTPLRERNILREFSSLLKGAGLPKRRMHDLRHTCVSLLSAQGVPLKTISEIVGHSDMRLTSYTYLHVFSEEKKQAADAMDRVLSRS